MSRDHIRENALRLQQNLLMEALGDEKAALWQACVTAATYHENMSPGFVRERLQRPVPPAIPKKEPLKGGPVLIEGE